MFDNDIKDFLLLWIKGAGILFLFGSMAIAFLEWNFDMGFFRTMIFGFILMATADYLKENK